MIIGIENVEIVCLFVSSRNVADQGTLQSGRHEMTNIGILIQINDGNNIRIAFSQV